LGKHDDRKGGNLGGVKLNVLMGVGGGVHSLKSWGKKDWKVTKLSITNGEKNPKRGLGGVKSANFHKSKGSNSLAIR